MLQPNWSRDDILTLGYKYGLRENLAITLWNDKNILLHDKLDWDMKIDLNPGAVSEVGVNQK